MKIFATWPEKLWQMNPVYRAGCLIGEYFLTSC